jgi:hypothetical protein
MFDVYLCALFFSAKPNVSNGSCVKPVSCSAELHGAIHPRPHDSHDSLICRSRNCSTITVSIDIHVWCRIQNVITSYFSTEILYQQWILVANWTWRRLPCRQEMLSTTQNVLLLWLWEFANQELLHSFLVQARWFAQEPRVKTTRDWLLGNMHALYKSLDSLWVKLLIFCEHQPKKNHHQDNKTHFFFRQSFWISKSKTWWEAVMLSFPLDWRAWSSNTPSSAGNLEKIKQHPP